MNGVGRRVKRICRATTLASPANAAIFAAPSDRHRGNCPQRNRLKLEINGQKETPGMKPGVYEQNIGSKYGSRH
jgi:hypothetical protein